MVAEKIGCSLHFQDASFMIVFLRMLLEILGCFFTCQDASLQKLAYNCPNGEAKNWRRAKSRRTTKSEFYKSLVLICLQFKKSFC